MIIASKKETFRILKEHNLIAKKGYGQNFLINYNTIQEIVSKSNIKEDTLVIEIGPGLGALTQELTKVAKQVIAIEIDKNMVEVLNAYLNLANLEIINEDFLKINLDELIEKYPQYNEVVIVSNLPYYITSDILEMIISNRNPRIKKIIAMMQKEVGKKFLKKEEKIESYLKVLIDNFTKTKTVIHVGKNDFEPRPNVDSIVLEFLLEKNKYDLDEYFFEMLKICLQNKRKTLLNNLPFSKEETSRVLISNNFKEATRIEELSILEFYKIIKEIKQK